MTKKFNSKEEIVSYLNTMPVFDMLDFAADAIWELQSINTSKIIISEEQFQAFFRLKGFKEDGTKENRGRLKGQTWKEK